MFDALPLDLIPLLLLCGAAFLAGAVDAIVGGGGLIQLPAMLLALHGYAPATILGTNKIASVFGTSIAAVNYTRRIRPTREFVVPMVIAAFVGSVLGAEAARHLPASSFEPLILIVLVLVWLYTWFRKDFGEIELPHPGRRTATLIAVGGGFGIGFYDGMIGPGTGSFLIFLLVGAVGMSFLRASATAKIVNVGTNVAALLLFALTGHLLIVLGLILAACNVAGSVLGSHLALRNGSRFVRIVFLIVVAALILRLAWQVF